MDTGSSALITRLALIMPQFSIIILFWNSSNASLAIVLIIMLIS